MTHLAHDDTKISALKLSPQGQVTLSKEAREQQKLRSGQTLLEISLPGLIILLPQGEVLAELMLKAQSGLNKLGLSVDELKTKVAERSEGNLSLRYPGVFDEQK